MDYILRRIENNLSLSDPGLYDHITYLRTRIEYSLFLCLGFLWKNLDQLSSQKQQNIVSNLNNLSIGSVVAAIRDLDANKKEIVGKRAAKILDSYPAIRNSKIGHGYDIAASVASALTPLYNDIIDKIPFLQKECDIVVMQQYDAQSNSYTGIRFPSNQNGQGVRWSCPKELIPPEETEFPRTYIYYEGNYHKVSPFVYVDPVSQTPLVFSSLVEKLTGKVRLCSIFPTLSGSSNQDIHFGELICLSTSDGSRQISQTNGTIMNSFEPNYSQYIDVGFQNLVEDFLNKNRAYVTATIWGHGGVGKTACVQKICYDFFNKNEKSFSYIIFITAKDRVYNPVTGTIDSNVGKGNIRLYSEVIASISAVLFDNVDSKISNEKLAEYEQRISNFEERILIVIDDYETFEDSEKEKISNFLSTLDARYHKAIITTRNKRFVIGQSISCNELDRSSTKSFIEAIVEKQYVTHLGDMSRILKDDDLLTCIYEATSGRPIFIYQFIYLFIQRGYQADLITGIRTSSNAQEFLYGRVYQYLSQNAQYIFATISTLTDDDLRFNLNILEHILSKAIPEKDQFEAGLEELVNQKIIEVINEVYGRVYSSELRQIMMSQYQKYPQDFQSTVKNFLDSVGGKNIRGSIFEAMLEQADRSRAFGNEKETTEKYRRILNDAKSPSNIQKVALKHLVDYLSNSRLNTPMAIKAVDEYLNLFADDPDIYMLYIYLLWSQGTEEKERAINTIQEFFSLDSHRKTDKRYLSFFALGTGYCIDFDIRYRKYSKDALRKKQYATIFNEYGKVLFNYVKSKYIKGKASLFHNIRVALIQTTKLCVAMGQGGKEPDKVLYGLDICKWMQESEVKEPFLSQITKLQTSLQNISLKTPHESTDALNLDPQIAFEQEDDDSAQDNIWSSGKQYSNGDIVDVTITYIAPYGAFASIDSTTTGLIHISEIADRYIADIESEFVVGESYKAQIVNIDSATKRISLSTVQFHD